MSDISADAFYENVQNIEDEGLSNSLKVLFKQNLFVIESLDNMKEVFITKIEKQVSDISVRLDVFIAGTARSTQVQPKRGGGGTKKEVKRSGCSANRNILGWIKERYIIQGPKLFDFVVDYQEVITDVLKINIDDLKKKKGVMRKKTEAALIWNLFRQQDPRVKVLMQEKFDEFKAQEKEKLSNPADPDASSSSSGSPDSSDNE